FPAPPTTAVSPLSLHDALPISRLLILDEPTAGVDPMGSAAMVELILKLKAQGKTVLITSHLLAQIEEICDRVAILDRGRVVLEGDRKSTRLNSSHDQISYAVFC